MFPLSWGQIMSYADIFGISIFGSCVYPLVNCVRVLTSGVCVCEYSYICGDGVAERRDKAQASVTQYHSEAVQGHTILHATDIHSLQIQRGTTYAHTYRGWSILCNIKTESGAEVKQNVGQDGGPLWPKYLFREWHFLSEYNFEKWTL